MRPSALVSTILIIPPALVAPLAWGHPGHETASLAAGYAHPLLGADHLLAMLAIGMWAAYLGGRRRWALPGAFLAAMAAGAAAALAGIALPAVEPMIAASVLALGLVLACGARASLPTGVAIAALFALFHGHAHGSEAAGQTIAAYLAGMLLASATLHALGVAAGTVLKTRMLRWTGAAVAASSAWPWLAGA